MYIAIRSDCHVDCSTFSRREVAEDVLRAGRIPKEAEGFPIGADGDPHVPEQSIDDAKIPEVARQDCPARWCKPHVSIVVRVYTRESLLVEFRHQDDLPVACRRSYHDVAKFRGSAVKPMHSNDNGRIACGRVRAKIEDADRPAAASGII